MSLHYNDDGSVLVVINFKGDKITATFHTEKDLDNFFKFLSQQN